MSQLRECKFKILDHPPYSPDLAPSDFYLFPKLKKELRGKRFAEKIYMENKILRIGCKIVSPDF
jgi:hypothetical protein